MRIILYHDSGFYFNPSENIQAEADPELAIDLCVQGQFTAGNLARIVGYCNELALNGLISSFDIVNLRPGEGWHKATNEWLGKNARQDGGQLLFLSSRVVPAKGCLAALAHALEDRPDLAGINPLFTDCPGAGALALHMGTVADSQGQIHYLYQGIRADSELAGKRRRFQLAHEGALLLREQDFHDVGGFNPNLDQLAFTDFCLRLAAAKGGFFSTEPAARATLKDKFDFWKTCGLWNSLAGRGKIEPGLLQADYHAHVIADGLEYGVTQWLNEGPVNLFSSDEGLSAPLLDWLASPEPRTLLRLLGCLSREDMLEAIALCRSYPCFLPHQMGFYESLAKRQLAFAGRHGLRRMAGQAGQWLREARRFHYKMLKPGISALAAAGIYKTSLDQAPSLYDAWLEISPGAAMRRLEIGRDWPAVAVAMPVYDPKPEFLLAALESVKAQTYGNWRLCISDDASTNPAIREILSSFAAADKRVEVVFRNVNGHISQATNSAIELAEAHWIAFLDHDDLLSRDALAEVAKKVAENSNLQLIYSDEDHLGEDGALRTPVFRQDFDFYLVFPGHLSAYRTETLREIGCMRVGYEGSQDFDLSLRFTEKISMNQVAHIPRILYHWRVHSQSTSGTVATKPYVLEATRKAMEASAARRGLPGHAVATEMNNIYNLAYEIKPDVRCSVILLAGRKGLSPELAACLASLAEKLNLELCWQPLNSGLQPPEELGRKMPLRVLPFAGEHWLAGCMNGARHARQETLLFISTDLRPLAACRPEQMVVLARRYDVACVGALIWKGGMLWHGGLYPDEDGMVFPLLRGTSKNIIPHYCWGQFLMTRRVLGVSWRCMAMRKEILTSGDEVFDSRMGALMCADFSLAQEELGRLTLVSPWGRWMLENPGDPAPDKEERRHFASRWGEKVMRHGLRNPNLIAAPDFNWTLDLTARKS